jgi:hypothetical protein
MFDRHNSTSVQLQLRRQPRALSPSAWSHKAPPLEMDAVNLVVVAVDAPAISRCIDYPLSTSAAATSPSGPRHGLLSSY